MWPGSLSAGGSPNWGAASRLTTTGRPPYAVRQTPTVDVPEPPGSSTQSGSGCHMLRKLADVALPEPPPRHTHQHRGDGEQAALRAPVPGRGREPWDVGVGRDVVDPARQV